MTNWQEELELIDNLGLLYPIIDYWPEYNKDWNNFDKAFWICNLCIYHLNQRIPQLEKFICSCSDSYYWWEYYKEYFNL